MQSLTCLATSWAFSMRDRTRKIIPLTSASFRGSLLRCCSLQSERPLLGTIGVSHTAEDTSRLHWCRGLTAQLHAHEIERLRQAGPESRLSSGPAPESSCRVSTRGNTPLAKASSARHRQSRLGAGLRAAYRVEDVNQVSPRCLPDSKMRR